MQWPPRQVFRQPPTPVSLVTPPLWRGRFRFVGRLIRCCRLVGGRVVRSVVVEGKQEELIGIETLAAPTIEPLQEQMQPLPCLFQVMIALPQRTHQFQDHLLEGLRLVGQLLRRWQWDLARGKEFGMGSSRAHTDKTQLSRKHFTKMARLTKKDFSTDIAMSLNVPALTHTHRESGGLSAVSGPLSAD